MKLIDEKNSNEINKENMKPLEIKIPEFNIKSWKNILALVFLIFVFSIYFYYGAFTNSWGFGDETYYYLAAKSMAKGDFDYIEKLYATGPLAGKGQPMEKPLLSYLIPAIFYLIGGGSLTIFKLYAPLFGILTVFLVFYFGKELKGYLAGLLAAIFIASTPLFIHFSIISYLDTTSTFFILLTIFTTYKALAIKNKKWIIIAGISFTLALYTKETAFFIPIIFLSYILVQKIYYKTFDKKEFKILLMITLIGLIAFSPWLIRNYLRFSNPVYPFFPEIFGYGGFDELGYKIRQANSASSNVTLGISLLYSYFGLTLLFISFGISYILLKIKKEYLLITLSIPILSLPFFLIVLKDIRYLFQLIPFLALPISFFLAEIMSIKDKKYNALFIIIIIFILYTSFTTLLAESSNINDVVRHVPQGILDAYKWVNESTPKNAVFMDLLTPNFVFYTDRVGVFTHHTNAGELFEFWKRPEDEALKLLEKHNVSYVIVETMYFQPPEVLKTMAWTAITKDFVYVVKNWGSFSLVYNNNYVLIYKVNYDKKPEPNALDKKSIF